MIFLAIYVKLDSVRITNQNLSKHIQGLESGLRTTSHILAATRKPTENKNPTIKVNKSHTLEDYEDFNIEEEINSIDNK